MPATVTKSPILRTDSVLLSGITATKTTAKIHPDSLKRVCNLKVKPSVNHVMEDYGKAAYLIISKFKKNLNITGKNATQSLSRSWMVSYSWEFIKLN